MIAFGGQIWGGEIWEAILSRMVAGLGTNKKPRRVNAEAQ